MYIRVLCIIVIPNVTSIKGWLIVIKEKRKEKKYTQEQMANLLGISLRQYVRIDQEEDLPRRDVLQKLISELDLTDNEIGKYIRNITKNTVA